MMSGFSGDVNIRNELLFLEIAKGIHEEAPFQKNNLSLILISYIRDS